MTWEEVKQWNPRYREVFLFVGRSGAESWDGLSTDLLELWERLPEMIRRVYEPRPDDKWDRIYCDLWVDSGQLIVFVGPDDLRRASMRAHISIESDFVDGLYHDLPDASHDPDAFEREYQLLIQRYLDALKVSLHNPASQRSLARLREWHPFKIVATELTQPDTAVDLD
jgi:hypothetical protein